MHHIPQEIKQQGCEELLHLGPKKRLCRELGISQGAIHARSIFVEQGFFDWVKEPAVKQRNETLVDTRTACCRKKGNAKPRRNSCMRKFRRSGHDARAGKIG